MNDKAILKNTIMTCLAGSHAYGTSTPESDVDVRGVFVADIDHTLGMQSIEQREGPVAPEDPADCVRFELKKFFNLAAACNPNIIELLYTPEECLKIRTPAWDRIRRHRDDFLSARARKTFLGYAVAQLKKIETHRKWLLNPPKKQPERTDFGLPENTALAQEFKVFLSLTAFLIKDRLDLEDTNDAVVARMQELDYRGLMEQTPLNKPHTQLVQDMLGLDNITMHLLQKEHQYHNALKGWNQYQSWKKNRNPKRAELEKKCGFDSKNGMHLVRLLRMGKEILTGQGVLVRRPDAGELLAIRNGAWSFERLIEYAESGKREIEGLAATSSLPAGPNLPAVNDLLIETYTRVLNIQIKRPPLPSIG